MCRNIERFPNIRDQSREMNVKLNATQVGSQPKSGLEVVVLVVVEEMAHVRWIESWVPEDSLSCGDVHRV